MENLKWRKATASNPSGNCVQVAMGADGNVHVRNSREVNGLVQTYTPAEWDAFLDGARNGEFDRSALAL